MTTTATSTATAHPAAVALTGVVDQAIAALTHDQLVGLEPDDLLATLHAVERVRNRLQVIDRELTAAAATTGLADRHAMPNLTRFLTAALRIEHSDAKERITAAEQLRATVTMTGDVLPPQRPVLADAVRTGALGVSPVTIIRRAVTAIGEQGATGEEQDRAETALVEHAQVLAPAELRKLAHRLVEMFDPDGTLIDEAGHEARRRVHLTRRRDGSYALDGRLTPEVGQQLTAVLGPLSKPATGAEGADLRDVRERTHDALGEIAARILRSGSLPEAGGLPATVIINLNLDTTTETTTGAVVDDVEVAAGLAGPAAPERVSRNGSGRFTDGTPVSLRAIARLADQAEVAFVFRDGLTGAVLNLSRTKRCASKDQTYALYARDQGCSFPGCDRPPSWCERHHVVPWLLGGPTDIDNLTLLCRYHHHNFERLGWECRMEQGIPVWYPPGYLDHARTPMINTRIRPPTITGPPPSPLPAT